MHYCNRTCFFAIEHVLSRTRLLKQSMHGIQLIIAQTFEVASGLLRVIDLNCGINVFTEDRFLSFLQCSLRLRVFLNGNCFIHFAHHRGQILHS